MRNSYNCISREDFEAWVELVDARVTETPGHSSSRIRAEGNLPTTEVKYRFEARGILVDSRGFSYGRDDSWNLVRIDTWPYNNFSLFGKGARSAEACVDMEELFELLVG